MFKTASKKAIQKKKTEAIGYLIDNEITKRIKKVSKNS